MCPHGRLCLPERAAGKTLEKSFIHGMARFVKSSGRVPPASPYPPLRAVMPFCTPIMAAVPCVP